ncbi:MAG: FxsA family protein [Candidatus Thiodiazotropha lotti]|nr:FxsA family protein [Candidatus Thiodiazotropha lotti]MCG7928652.1 FxsA family protein [Candidatus Thiodiazotropha lotti]MCG8005583.1 FxsA family protein [Candidatus Thiodiazotropha lotti]MCW4189212.1 FxsA family protein [Candidatus Thiodiazotropha lotti]MCW4200517.1 FxsA family protein [Candidatus Thiodiazotropha lotti]
MERSLLPVALLVLALSEVATTGLLYDWLGIVDLVVLYFITTCLGAAILLTQSGFMKRIAKEAKKRAKGDDLHDELQKQLDGGEATEGAKEWGVLTAQGVFHTAAWALILIPGLITDALSYVLIGMWFARKDRVSKML